MSEVERLTAAELAELRANWQQRVGRIPANGLRLLDELEEREKDAYKRGWCDGLSTFWNGIEAGQAKEAAS